MVLSRNIMARLNRIHLIDRLVYTANHGPAHGLKRQGGLGWLPSFMPRPHEWDAEEAFLASLDWQGLIIYDVGGDQGLFTLFFAHRVGERGQVIVFEPNPQSCQRIQENVKLNNFSNVRIMPLGLGNTKARLEFAYPALEPARGTANRTIADQIKHEATARICEIEVNSLDDELERRGLPAPDFIKMDIEGMEYVALEGMQETLRNYRPRLSIEIHGIGMEEKISNAQRVVGLMERLSYEMWHIESGKVVTAATAATGREGHIFCKPLTVQ
jgi:FkbM family methyltransferase